ncbi:Bax inhibitor-1/YccA family protein [Roseibacillus persicicus]|uniref:Permease n=1 Tax=Roseibacillus persicicus TaxID=454148 RepID=A0A918TTQ9_9BACT|nr:Bax inhibitor-1 family protein [Roseibacillus persicicus]MDQ8188765.1 Bax inhibitor-1 family protein [Roseibacillus persicicus]GHC63021.1 permease [Roseibacillus persicicus]
MFDQANPYSVSAAPVDQRAEFIRKTYFHVAGAIGMFALLLSGLLQIPAVVNLAFKMTGGMNWLIVLGAFMGVSWLANKWAHSSTSLSTQYLGLGLYVIAEAIIFLPIMAMATLYSSPAVIPQAALATLALFLALTFVAFTTKKDFSFLGGILKVGFLIALAVIVAGVIFGFNLGLVFSAVMVALAAGSILYNTSNMIHHYRTDQYVAASLGLFASIALLFWYILRIFMSRD